MAKITAAPAPAPAAASAEPTPIKKKRSKLPLILGIVLLLAGAGGGAAWHLMHNGDAPPGGAAEAKPASKPIFVNLEPFTVNLAEEGGDHYLQVGIVYQVADDKVSDAIKQHMPILRNRLLMLLSAKRPSELASNEGKKKLVDELVVAARESLPGSAPDRGVTTALLGSFVIQ